VSASGKTFTLAEGTTVTLDAGIGRAKTASHSAATAGLYGAQSPTSFYNLEGVLSDPSDSGLPWCSNITLLLNARQPS
jgi:hypothetical protein